ncbi:hypothetical protein P4H71_26810 [Paenibacillus kribbensis]|nr:hypothetical protein [Paenibacillus kribbensis]EHS59478.1 hypothetical protein WG8_0431 [Paenibacillus sp. Aloe-11]MEC0237930.1 hypothetical protein [Paenibacillus kribbensis]
MGKIAWLGVNLHSVIDQAETRPVLRMNGSSIIWMSTGRSVVAAGTGG